MLILGETMHWSPDKIMHLPIAQRRRFTRIVIEKHRQ